LRHAPLIPSNLIPYPPLVATQEVKEEEELLVVAAVDDARELEDDLQSERRETRERTRRGSEQSCQMLLLF